MVSMGGRFSVSDEFLEVESLIIYFGCFHPLTCPCVLPGNQKEDAILKTTVSSSISVSKSAHVKTNALASPIFGRAKIWVKLC